METAKYIIRETEEDDVGELTGLYGAFLDETLAGDPSIERNPELRVELSVARLVSREKGAMLVAEAQGDVAGFAFVEVRASNGRPKGLRARLMDFFTRRRAFLPVILPDRGWLGHLYVAHAHRRRGIATALVRAAADWARSHGATSFELNVLAANGPARRLYEKLGMTATLVDYRMKL